MTMNIPTQTMTIRGTAWPIINLPLIPEWVDKAKQGGFDLVARVKDCRHLALRCENCSELSLTKVFTLRTAQPVCQTCLKAGREATAEAAGLTYLHRCALDPSKYGIYRAACGHELRRQFGEIRCAAAGEVRLRCETCHAAKEAGEAAQHGWEILGPDPRGNANYRLYRHHGEGEEAPCGHVQRIARANMQSQRVNCEQCGQGWASAPSQIYAMRFGMGDGNDLIKLGFSRNPGSRLHYQLKRALDQDCELLRVIPVRTGHLALQLEKRMHLKLKAHDPEAVISPELYRTAIRVRSEIYHARLRSAILRMLDAVERSGRWS